MTVTVERLCWKQRYNGWKANQRLLLVKTLDNFFRRLNNGGGGDEEETANSTTLAKPGADKAQLASTSSLVQPSTPETLLLLQ